MSTLSPATTPAPNNRAWRRVALILVGVYLLASLPLILLLGPRGRPGEDQINYHAPTVHAFARQLPTPDLSDYLSATTPGYHLVLATVERLVSGDERVLQLAGAAFTLLLLILLARTVCSRADIGWGELLVLCLPFVCSMYVLQAGVWMLPDNAGWLFVLACLALALREPFGRRTIILGGLTLVALVFVRQVHLWAAGVLWAAAWLAPGIDEPAGAKQLLARLPQRLRSLAPMVAASIPAFVVLALFVRLWGGLTPPAFQGQYSRPNPASFAFLLSLFGIGSVFFVGYLLDPLVDMVKTRRGHVAIAALAGGVVAIIPPTTYSVAEGRFSGIWNLAARVPSIAGHTSPVLVVLAAFGAVMLVIWCRALPARERWIFLGAWFGFAMAQMFSSQLWQRYNEPMVLMMLALMAARSRPTGTAGVLVRNLLAPLRIGAVATLALLLAGLSAYTISRFGPAAVYDLDKLNPSTKQSTP